MSNESKEQLLQRMSPVIGVPHALVQDGIQKLDTPVKIPEDTYFPTPNFTKYRLDERKRRLPQCVSHRGYKAVFPENTMAAFKGAVQAGTHALETDVHSTKDNVVVISHDPKLTRMYGIDKKIQECNWDEIKAARTKTKPPQPLPRLKELLEYLAEPGMEEMWLILDIKLTNDAETIMRNLSATLASVTPPASKAWKERVVIGVWAAKYLQSVVEHLSGFPVTCIGFSVQYARNFLRVPNISMNMMLPVLFGPGGNSFIRDCRQKHHRQVYTWVANDRRRMEWCIRRKLDCVITEDPKLFLEVCEKFDEYKKEKWPVLNLRDYYDLIKMWLWVSIAMFLYRRRLKEDTMGTMIERAAK